MQKEKHLVELARGIVLNPEQARMMRRAKDWPWLSGDGRPERGDEVAADGMDRLGLRRQKGLAGSV